MSQYSEAMCRLVTRYLTVLRTLDERLIVECPGWQLHTKPGREADVKVLGGRPVLKCFHTSCEAEVTAVNRELWAELDELPLEERPQQTLEEKIALEKEKKLRRQLRELNWSAKHRLLPKLSKVSPEEWLKHSPCPLAEVTQEEQAKLFLQALYRQKFNYDWEYQHLWIGERWESGPDFTGNFRTVADWLKVKYPLGPQVSTWLFHRRVLDTGERKRANALRKLFLVLDCDHLDYETQGGVIEWVANAKHLCLRLRAIVDTGGKSLHSWFSLPPEPPPWPERELDFEGDLLSATRPIPGACLRNQVREQRWLEKVQRHEQELRKLYAVLEGLDADPKMLKSSLTARLPGMERFNEEGNPTGRWQRLIYLDPIFPVL